MNNREQLLAGIQMPVKLQAKPTDGNIDVTEIELGGPINVFEEHHSMLDDMGVIEAAEDVKEISPQFIRTPK